MRLIPKRGFTSSVEVYQLKATLENEGIPSILKDEHTNTMYGSSLSNPIGGLELFIHQKDIEKTKEILNGIQLTPLTLDTGDVLKCPKCQSQEIQNGYTSNFRDIKGIIGLIMTLVLGIMPLFSKRVYKCNHCNHEFNNQ